MRKIFLERIDKLEAVAKRQRRKFDFGAMTAAELWTLSVRASELRGFKQYYWQVEAQITNTPPPFVNLPIRLEELSADELSDICTAVREESRRRFDGDAFSIEAQLHRAALDELVNQK